MEAQQEENEIVVTDENIKELITSKNFKNRVLAYQNICQYPDLIGHLQNESLAVALEVALDSLLKYEGKLMNDQISNFYNQLSQSKASIRSKIAEIIEKTFDNDSEAVMKRLSECYEHKNSKVVSSSVARTNNIIKTHLEMFRSAEWRPLLISEVCSKLEMLFGSADKDVKQETADLTITLFSIFYDDIYKYIGNIKPILLNPLKEAFSTIEIPKKVVKFSDYDFDSANWKERLEGVNALKENIKNMSNASEYYSIISRKVKDVNLSVATAAIETIKNGKISHDDCIRNMIERFKDKKQTISNLIKDAIDEIRPDFNILIDGLENKNPEIKVGILECLVKYGNLKRIKDIGKLLEDSSADVRHRTVALLENQDDLSELNEAQLSKINKISNKPPAENVLRTHATILKNEKPLTKHVEKSVSGTSPNSSFLSSKSYNITFDCAEKMDLRTKSRIYDDFVAIFPFFLEKDWNKRLELLKQNKSTLASQGLENLALFMISCKESNFFILKELLSIFETASDPLPSQLCSYLNTKVTEPKLRENIIVLYKRFDQEFVVKNFISQLKTNKSGKKCTALWEVLGCVLTSKNTLLEAFLKTYNAVTFADKKALADFKLKYAKLPATVPSKTKDPLDLTASQPNTGSNAIFIAGFDYNLENQELENVFTSEFMNMADKDPFNAINRLESIDQCKICYTLIKLYCKYNLPSPYFNSLILNFISKKYILKDLEAELLLNYLVKENMENEIELIDRVYPATKIYKILRNYPQGTKYIMNMLYKYKKVEEIKDSEKLMAQIIRENEDFIGFTLGVDKLVLLKNEMLKKYSDENISKIIDEKLESFSENIANEDKNQGEVTQKELNNCFVDFDEIKEDINESFGNTQLDAPNFNENMNSLGDIESTYVIENSASENSSDKELNGTCAKRAKSPSFIRQPSILEDDIEKNLSNLSIVLTPRKKTRNVDEMQSVISNLKSGDSNIIKETICKLNKMSLEMSESVANSIMQPFMIQFIDHYDNRDLRDSSLDFLLKITQNKDFCSFCSYETLKAVHKCLISIVKESNTSADILINMCLNGGTSLLKVYFDLLENSNDILMKLIWRHSKSVDYSSIENVAHLVGMIDEFYTAKSQFLFRSENVLLKVCLLHLKECIFSFSDNIKQFGVGIVLNEIVDLLIGKKDLSLDQIRICFNK